MTDKLMLLNLLLDKLDAAIIHQGYDFVKKQGMTTFSNSHMNALGNIFQRAVTYKQLETKIRELFEHQTVDKNQTKWIVIKDQFIKHFFGNWDNKFTMIRNELDNSGLYSDVQYALEQHLIDNSEELKLEYSKRSFLKIYSIYIVLKSNLQECENIFKEINQC